MWKKKYKAQYAWNKRNPEKIKAYQEKWNKNNPTYANEHVKRYFQTLKGKFNQYKGKSKQKNRKWELSFKDFKEFWQKPCYYCGDKIKTIGIDRVDSKIGYIKSNCVPCCEICNKAKLCLSKEEFIAHCKKVVNHNI